jgi:hypothetical protein
MEAVAMTTELVPWGGELVLQSMDDRVLFDKRVDTFVDDVVWPERERRLRAWVAEGLTQKVIGERTGHAQRTVSHWMKRFDIKPLQTHKPHLVRDLATPAKSESDESKALKDRVAELEAKLVAVEPEIKIENDPDLVTKADTLESDLKDVRKALKKAMDDNGDLVDRLDKYVNPPNPDKLDGGLSEPVDELIDEVKVANDLLEIKSYCGRIVIVLKRLTKAEATTEHLKGLDAMFEEIANELEVAKGMAELNG